MADKVKQTSTGDNSPNSSFINNGLLLLNSAVDDSAGREVHTMVALIKYLTNNSETVDLTNADTYRKSFQEKLNKYPDVRKAWADEYVQLATLYDDSYRKGWDAEDIGEAGRKKIALYLQRHSIELLEQHANDANNVIPALCGELKTHLPDDGYDEGAVRYFMLSQFSECNILPIT